MNAAVSIVLLAAVLGVIDNLIPGTIGLQRRLQTLQAILHCSRRSLLPSSLRDVNREDVLREITEVRRHLAAT